MFFISKASNFVAQRALPVVGAAAAANPISATALAAGAVGLAAWKGAEVAVQAPPFARKVLDKLHQMTAPKGEVLVVTEAEHSAEVQAVTKAAEDAIAKIRRDADKAIRAATEAAEAAKEAVQAPAPTSTPRRNGGHAAGA